MWVSQAKFSQYCGILVCVAHVYKVSTLLLCHIVGCQYVCIQLFSVRFSFDLSVIITNVRTFQKFSLS